jgi:flagellar assembly protein FliH
MPPALDITLPAPVREVSVVGGPPADKAGGGGEPGEQAAAALRRQMEQSLQRDKAALASAQQALQQAAAQIQQLQQQVVAEAEEQLVQLAVEIAQKVLAQEIKAEGYDIDPIVKEALEQAPVRKNVVVRLNPADLSRCEVAGAQDEEGEIRFVADADVPPAGCVVETGEGVVESAPAQRLDEVADALKESE